MAKGMFFDVAQTNPRQRFNDAFITLANGINPVQLVAASFIALSTVLF